jgi:hypothetical protein
MIETTHTSTLKKNSPRILVLNREKIRPILKKSIIAFFNLITRKNTFGGIGNMKDIIETNIMIGGMI